MRRVKSVAKFDKFIETQLPESLLLTRAFRHAGPAIFKLNLVEFEVELLEPSQQLLQTRDVLCLPHVD